MLVAETLCFTQSYPINNRSMIQGIADNGVLLLK